MYIFIYYNTALFQLKMAKRVVVFGVDTAVGAAVAFHLAIKAGYEVLGVKLTINTDPLELKAAQGVNPSLEGEVELPSRVRIMPCNLELIENIEHVIRGSDACFVHTYSNFYNPRFTVHEQMQGRNISTAIQRRGIPHTVFCTQPHTLDIRHIGCRHFTVKAETEEYMKITGIPCTYLILPRFYEEILQYLAPVAMEGKGSFKLAFGKLRIHRPIYLLIR